MQLSSFLGTSAKKKKTKKEKKKKKKKKRRANQSMDKRKPSTTTVTAAASKKKGGEQFFPSLFIRSFTLPLPVSTSVGLCLPDNSSGGGKEGKREEGRGGMGKQTVGLGWAEAATGKSVSE